MKKLTNILLVIASAFVFSSCGDSKDKIFDDSIDLMEEMAVAIEEGDEDKVKELEAEGKELQKRAEELGLDVTDKDSLSDDQKKRLEEAMKKMMSAAFSKMGQ